MAKAENKEGWESSEFPIICETCLGDNPYMRMTRNVFGDECKVCGRPFTVFRWSPGARMRFKKTEICQSCSKLKNVCQTCLLDLQYSLPVQVRDSLLKINSSETVPKGEANRQFFNQNILEKKLALGESLIDYGKVGDSSGIEVAKKIKRDHKDPYYTRNLPHVCSFYVRGKCKRGDECPYRHQLDARDEQLSNQKIKDRFYGVNDPVAMKILDKLPKTVDLTPPEDKSITTLLLIPCSKSSQTNMEEEEEEGEGEGENAEESRPVHPQSNDLSEKMIRDYFYSFGEIESIVITLNKYDKKIAFIRYEDREDAELAMKKCLAGVTLNDEKLYKVAWSRPKKVEQERKRKEH